MCLKNWEIMSIIHYLPAAHLTNTNPGAGYFYENDMMQSSEMFVMMAYV